MSYDAHLAARIRDLLAGNPDITEKAMFGGLAFLVAGKMALAASGQGGLLVRADPARAEHLLATTDAEPMQMKGRSVRGWLRVGSDHVGTDRQLAEWIAVGTSSLAGKPEDR